MKILRIREGKLKLTLSAEEATEYGILYGRVPSSKELSAIVRRLLGSETEAWGSILAEAYPKTDGSCDIFVSEERERERRAPSGGGSLFGFHRREDAAFALYVLSGYYREPQSIEAGGQESPARGSSRHPSRERHEESLPPLVYDFLIRLKDEENPPWSESNHNSLPSFSLYLTERMEGEGYNYILEILDVLPEGARLALTEFGRELPKISPELLTEHTRRVEFSELLTGR